MADRLADFESITPAYLNGHEIELQLLDVLLGEEIQTFDKKRILEMIKMNSSEILEEEMKIAVGAMELFDKTVASVMTTIDVRLFTYFN